MSDQSKSALLDALRKASPDAAAFVSEINNWTEDELNHAHRAYSALWCLSESGTEKPVLLLRQMLKDYEEAAQPETELEP